MCISKILKLFEKPLDPTGQPDYIKGCDPTQDYLDGKMPTYTIPDLIEHLEFRKSIHETFYGGIIQGTLQPNLSTGDANFHIWAIEGYECAVYYLKRLQ